ncbi:hypothetical protein CCACVL1_02344, partial [Corchorus capsularis]
MTRRTRKSPSSSSQFSAKPPVTRSKHHRKIPHEKSYYYSDDDNVDTSQSHYPIESNGNDELEQQDNHEDDYDNEVDDASEYQSESMAINDPNPHRLLMHAYIYLLVE